jgi:DNA-binding MurR/RpiR family transcriptional regulator
VEVTGPGAGSGESATIGELVRDRMGSVTPAERKVARALLAAYPVAGLESLTQLAAQAGVAAPTVLRFVRKLGFEGFPEFQRALRSEVQARMSSPVTLYRAQALRGRDEILGRSLRTFARALEKTFHAVPASEFQAVVRLLSDERRRVVLTGGRFSQLLAHYLYVQLNMLRPGCVLVGSTFDPRGYALVDIGPGDVVCVFDYRRYQEDTVVYGRAAAARGAVVVAFTDPWLSPVAEVADHVLTAYPDAPSPFDSMVAALALSEAVLAGVVARLGERGRRRVELVDRALAEPLAAPTRTGRRRR